MNDLALYRKYRPQSFADVLGQEQVIKVLEGAIKEGHIAHAYLFAGSRGTGKTSVARIFAKEIGTKGNDLYEIDAASNRGIDDVRALREAVHILPFESPYKVYIIDEAHMLTKEAFNALLKTLEEPPKHAIFILATTEFDKLPETIVSRCQTFTFKKPSQRVVQEMVLRVAKAEGYTIEPASADLIALLADGSYRDAHGILQKIIASSADKKISIEEVEEVTGAPRGTLVNDLLLAIEKGDIERALETVRSASAQGVDSKLFLTLVLAKIRAVLLVRYAPSLVPALKEEYTEEDFAFLRECADMKQSAINAGALQELLAAYDLLGTAVIPEVPLEIALITLLAPSEKHHA